MKEQSKSRLKKKGISLSHEKYHRKPESNSFFQQTRNPEKVLAPLIRIIRPIRSSSVDQTIYPIYRMRKNQVMEIQGKNQIKMRRIEQQKKSIVHLNQQLSTSTNQKVTFQLLNKQSSFQTPMAKIVPETCQKSLLEIPKKDLRQISKTVSNTEQKQVLASLHHSVFINNQNQKENMAESVKKSEIKKGQSGSYSSIRALYKKQINVSTLQEIENRLNYLIAITKD